MDHFFITNRKIIGNRISESGRETAQESLRFGSFNIKTQDYQLYPDKKVSLGSVFPTYQNKSFDKVGSGRFFKLLYDAMIDKNGGDVLVFVHGFDTDLKGAWGNVTDLHNKYVLDPDCPVKHIVIFTWPGKDTDPPLHYRDDFKDADRSGDEFYRVVKMLQKFNESFFQRRDQNGDRLKPCRRKIHLMCHSMGHVVLRSLMREAKKQGDSFDSVFSEILLMAANIEWDDLQPGRDMDELERLGDRTHIYYNKSDDVLDIARYTKRRFRKQLGRYGVKNIADLGKNIFQVDTTKLKRDEPGWLDHWYYYKSNLVIKDVSEVLNSDTYAEDIRTKVTKRKKRGSRDYQLIKR